MFRFLLMTLCFLSLASCSQRSSVEKETRALKETMESLRDSLSDVDSLSVVRMQTVLSRHLDTMNSRAFDSARRDIYIYEGTALDRTAKGLKKFQMGLSFWKTSLAQAEVRLGRLANDIHTHYVDTTQASKYLQDEKGLLLPLMDQARTKLSIVRYAEDNTDSLDARMRSIWKEWKK